MSVLDPRVWLAIIVLMVCAYGAGRLQQHHVDGVAMLAERAAAVQKARDREEQWQSDAAVAEGIHDQELRRLAAAHRADLDRLRERPERVPEAAAAACVGTTGAQLSRPDAGFLVGEAARADGLRAELERCRAWVETVTGAVKQ